jgi:uncharacterized protein YfaS (alpha-2-macroglobulin family)
MQGLSETLIVITEKSNYGVGERVVIRAALKYNGLPGVNESIRLVVRRPDGSAASRISLTTDSLGIAADTFTLKKKDPPGSYAIEAHSAAGSMALTSFLVI